MTQETTSFKLKNALTELDALFQHVERFGNLVGLPKKQIFQINLALDELFTNIVSYGYTDNKTHWIKFNLRADSDAVKIRIEDSGIAFDPVGTSTSGSAPPLEDCKIGGLGLHIVKKIMDQIDYTRKGNKNIITIKKYIGP